jgi:hypothetical protein
MRTTVFAVLGAGLFVGGAFWLGGQNGRKAELEFEGLNQKISELNNVLQTQAEQIKQLESVKETLSNSTLDDFARLRRDRDSKWLEKDDLFEQLGVIDAENFLENSRIGDLFTEIRLAKKFTEVPETLKNMSGLYRGQITGENQSPVTLEVNLKLKDELWDDQLKGKLVIRLLKNGKEFVSSGNEGKLEAVSQLEGSKGALLFHARPTHYFQVYPLARSRSLIGNYYRQMDKAGTYEFLGSFELTRK